MKLGIEYLHICLELRDLVPQLPLTLLLLLFGLFQLLF
jgi:hypothetical protein